MSKENIVLPTTRVRKRSCVFNFAGDGNDFISACDLHFVTQTMPSFRQSTAISLLGPCWRDLDLGCTCWNTAEALVSATLAALHACQSSISHILQAQA